jgi:hypothetical protein
MRDCVFLVADSNMEAAFQGFLGREKFWLGLDCGEFLFDPTEDLFPAAGDNDPGLFTRGHELLKPYCKTHRHGVIVLDAAWEGSPGATQIHQHIAANITGTGWQPDCTAVIVIDPELENWFWQRANPHVAKALGFADASLMVAHPLLATHWPATKGKPDQPKECLEAVLKDRRKARSSALYKKVTAKVGTRGCKDDAFQSLRETLQAWFPAGDQT